MPFAKTECTCIVCGKRFISGSCRGKFCGDKCRKIKAREKSKEKNQKRKMRRKAAESGRTLSAAEAEAREMGISYGQYVAMQDRRKHEHKVQ